MIWIAIYLVISLKPCQTALTRDSVNQPQVGSMRPLMMAWLITQIIVSPMPNLLMLNQLLWNDASLIDKPNNWRKVFKKPVCINRPMLITNTTLKKIFGDLTPVLLKESVNSAISTPANELIVTLMTTWVELLLNNVECKCLMRILSHLIPIWFPGKGLLTVQ